VNYAYHTSDCRSSSTESCFQRAVTLAANNNDGQLITFFLKRGVDPNLLTNRGFGGMRSDGHESYGVIHTVLLNGNSPNCLKALLAGGADPNIPKHYSYSSEWGGNQNETTYPIHLACSVRKKKHRAELTRLLLLYGAKVDQLHHYLQEVQVCDARGHDPRSGNYFSGLKHYATAETALHIALRTKDHDLAHLLVIAGADVNIPIRSDRKKKTVEALCKGQPLLTAALSCKFQTTCFKGLPALVQQEIKTFLLCNLRCKWDIPFEIMCEIFTYLIRDYWTEKH